MHWPSSLLGENPLHLENQVTKLTYSGKNIIVSNSVFSFILTNGSIDVVDSNVYVVSSTFSSCTNQDIAGAIKIYGGATFYLRFLCFSKVESFESCHVLFSELADKSLIGRIEQTSISDCGNIQKVDVIAVVGGSSSSKNINISHSKAIRVTGYTLRDGYTGFVGYSSFDGNIQKSLVFHFFCTNINLFRCNFLNHRIDENDTYKGLLAGTDSSSVVESCNFQNNSDILMSSHRNASISCYRCFSDKDLISSHCIFIFKTEKNAIKNEFRYKCGIGCHGPVSLKKQVAKHSQCLILTLMIIK